MATLSRRARTAETRKATEAELLRAAVSLLEEGTAYADISIEQIVRRAGFTRPTFYTYFNDKRALVLKLGAALEADLSDAAEPWLSFADVPLRDTLTGVLAVFTRHRVSVGAITEAATYDPEVAAFWQAFHDRFRPGAERRIVAGDPDLPAAGVAARAYALVYMTERAFTEHVARPTLDEQALIDQVTWLWQAAT
ncbi:TetR/AcrR family transcriptional regulator [Patulibacter minatonensis]|uniref:TetR/AcrR family transcriptional regulator n=1 Tax=Patulibacter minatonensis TaxID=298163 RepID=UPI00047E4C27|nr:TetR/AcrR family transcriptional regulator [Patulibacter minatonensis]